MRGLRDEPPEVSDEKTIKNVVHLEVSDEKTIKNVVDLDELGDNAVSEQWIPLV